MNLAEHRLYRRPFLLSLALAAPWLAARAAEPEAEVWHFRSNFIYDKWNYPILPYVAAYPRGRQARTEELRAELKKADLARLIQQAGAEKSKRVVKRQLVSELKTDADVAHAKTYLLINGRSAAVDVFQLALGYIDQFGLLAILQTVVQWQCDADEACPAKTQGKLEELLARGGKIMKVETFHQAHGHWWVAATITYEIPLGQEQRVVLLRSRRMPVLEVP